MRVVVPYTRLIPECQAALARAARTFPIDYVNVSADQEAYWRLLRQLWAERETVVIVEHDIVVRPDSLAEFAECPHEWCAFAYLIDDVTTIAGFGCVRFRAPLLAATVPPPEPLPWWNLDGPIEYELGMHGYMKHVHLPPLLHLNPNVLLRVAQRRTLDPTPLEKENQAP